MVTGALLDLLGGPESWVQLTAGANLQALELSPMEGFVLSRVGSGMRLRELCQVSGLGEDQTLRIVQRLQQSGVLACTPPRQNPALPREPGRSRPLEPAGRRLRSGDAVRQPLWKRQPAAPAGPPGGVRAGEPDSAARRVPPPPAAPAPPAPASAPSTASLPPRGGPVGGSGALAGGEGPPPSRAGTALPAIKVQDRSGTYRLLQPSAAREGPPPGTVDGDPRRPTRRSEAPVLPLATPASPPTAAGGAGPVGPAAASEFRTDTPPPEDMEEIAAAAHALPPALQEEEVDLEPELRRRIVYLHDRRRELDYYQLLAVRRDADRGVLRRAFLRRTQLLHPDRYFRKNLGSYAGRLHDLYKAVSVAYDTLADPRSRALYDRTLELAQGPLDGRGQAALRQAEQLYAEGKRLAEVGDYLGAARALRQAMELQPREDRYRVLLLRVQSTSRQQETAAARRQAEELVAHDQSAAAVELLRRVVATAAEPELLVLLARLLLGRGKELHEAQQHARRALQLQPDSLEAALTLSALEEGLGDRPAARSVLAPFLQLAAGDRRLQERLRELEARS